MNKNLQRFGGVPLRIQVSLVEGELYLNKAIYSHTGCSSGDTLHAFRRKDVVILFSHFLFWWHRMEVRLDSTASQFGSEKGTLPCAWETGEFGLKWSSVYLEAHNWGWRNLQTHTTLAVIPIAWRSGYVQQSHESMLQVLLGLPGSSLAPQANRGHTDLPEKIMLLLRFGVKIDFGWGRVSCSRHT